MEFSGPAAPNIPFLIRLPRFCGGAGKVVYSLNYAKCCKIVDGCAYSGTEEAGKAKDGIAFVGKPCVSDEGRKGGVPICILKLGGVNSGRFGSAFIGVGLKGV